MATVTAARWDVEWDRGGGWWVRLGRRARTGDVLPIAAPSTLEVRPVDAPSTTPALLTVAATVNTDGSYADIEVTPTHIATLSGDRYEYRAIVTDATRSLPLLLLRGYVAIRDTVGDD